jgi:hypothetical protein
MIALPDEEDAETVIIDDQRDRRKTPHTGLGGDSRHGIAMCEFGAVTGGHRHPPDEATLADTVWVGHLPSRERCVRSGGGDDFQGVVVA